MKKVTLISGYYYPEDTAIGLYNTQMINYLEEKGYQVNVITGFPNYPQWKIKEDYRNYPSFFYEEIGKTKVYRYKQYVPARPTFFKRILLILDITFGSLFNMLKIKETDLVISVVPFTSTVLLGWLLKIRKKAKLWIHIQDFEFDAANDTGLSSKESALKSFIFKILFKFERALFNKGDINSSISYSMINRLKLKSGRENFYFPNWIDVEQINPIHTTPHKYLSGNKFKILYSGNIGDKQDWEFFLKFATAIRNYNTEIIVVGDGAKREWLCGKINNLENVSYYPPVDYEELSSLLCSADLHILFQKNSVIDSVMPSKLLGMMASAKPSLIKGNLNSEVKAIIEKSNGGFYLDSDKVEDFLVIINDLMKNNQSLETIGFRARDYVKKEFSLEKVLSSFETKIADLINS